MHPRLFIFSPLCLPLALIALSQTALASILAIDYGSDWIKASLIKPGLPFDVLLNKDSKRKIQATVGWKKNDRLFGSDGFNVAARFPSDSFSNLKILQGVPFESESVAFYNSIAPVEVIPSARDTVSLRLSNGTEWSVEELIAMQFAYVKDLAETAGGEKVHDVILTVPPFYTQFERDAVVDSMEIAGMRVLALINDGTAVGVNYAMTRTFPTLEHHVIFDAGASAIRATVLSFHTVAGDAKKKSTSQDSTHITVSGVGYDRGVGGMELDRRLRNMLISDFESKHGKDIKSDKRGMAKMWKESGRIKAILSANNDATSTIESVAFDIDFKTKISRTAFEAECADLKPRFAQPILDALSNAGLTLDNITSVILTGGHSRTPMVQAAVKAVVGDNKIATNVNADEAAVLGSAFYAASVSKQFRTKDVKVQDIGVYDLSIAYPSESKTPGVAPKIINTVIFPAGSKVGSKKTVTFKRKDDFTIKMQYKTSPGLNLPTELSETEIIGVKDALGNLTERGAIDPVVKATVVLSESGFAAIQDAVAYGEIKETLAGKLKGFFGGGSSSLEDESLSSETSTSAASESATESSSSASASGTTSSPATSATPEKKAEKPQDTIPLVIDTKPLSIPALSNSEKRSARDRLVVIDNAEAAQRRREDARNSLEGYLYRMRDRLEDDLQTPFMRCSKDEERRVISDKVRETLTWMQDEGENADTIAFWDKRNTVEQLEKPIIHRYKEIEAFPEALNNSQKWNWATRMFLSEALTNLTAEDEAGLPSKWSHEELDQLEKKLREHESWLGEWVEKQKAVKQNEDPVILTTEMRARAKTLENALGKLARRRVAKFKKEKAETTTVPVSPGSEETASASTSSGASGGEEKETTTIPSEPTPNVHDEL